MWREGTVRAKIVALTAGLAVVIGLAGPVGAITNGTPDGTAHPYVGVVVFYGAADEPVGRCSGELLSRTVFLTSGHCITLNHGVTGEVWFVEQATTTKGTGNVGSLRTSPDGELGAVIFETPVLSVGTFASLPEAGAVDGLANKTPLVIVGYGVTEQDKISGNPIGRWNDPTDRVMATSALVSGTQSGSEGLLKHQNGPGGGSGGGCFHDSGGPILLPGSTTVLAINAFVNNANCTGIGYGTRLDTTEHLAWIESLP
jgi:hypothetical protein